MREGVFIFINKTKTYEQDLKRKIISKHKIKNLERITHIESLIKSSSNMQKLINSSRTNFKNFLHFSII